MVQRLNRRLERDSKVLRSPRGDVDRSRFGNYFIVETIRNVVVHAKLSPRQLEETARQLGVLSDGEEVERRARPEPQWPSRPEASHRSVTYTSRDRGMSASPQKRTKERSSR
jgi:hypothetical protein